MNKLTIERINEMFTETLPLVLSDETYNFLQSLPTKQRLCFIMRNIYDYSYKQIGETLEISVASVGMNIREANIKSYNLIKQTP